MKKHLLLPLLAFAVFLSCNKKNDEEDKGDYYVKYKLNGTLTTHTGSIHSWVKPNTANPSEMMFELVAPTNDFKHSFAFTIQKNNTLGTGAYTTTDYPSYSLTVDYFQNIGMPDQKDFSADTAPGMPPSVFSVNVTEITSTYTKGTFTSNYLYDNITEETIEITDGEFFVKRNPPR